MQKYGAGEVLEATESDQNPKEARKSEWTEEDQQEVLEEQEKGTEDD